MNYPEAEELAARIAYARETWTAPFVLIMRGMPGSGKSTLARELSFHCRAKSLSVEVLSADDFLPQDDNGNAIVNRESLANAHATCQQRFLLAFGADTAVIVIDNTNVLQREFSFYHTRCERERVNVFIVNFKCDTFECAEKMAARTGKHFRDEYIAVRYGQFERASRELEEVIDMNIDPRF